MDIRDLYLNDYIGKKVKIQGWVRNHRKQSQLGFIDLSDGTCFEHLQVVYDDKLSDFQEITKIKIGSALTVEGKLVESPKADQKFE